MWSAPAICYHGRERAADSWPSREGNSCRKSRATNPKTSSMGTEPRQPTVFTSPYKDELCRTLGSFSSFAAGFSYISILTGMFQMFHVGYGAGGPAFFWTWPTVFVGQLLVALCFAELAAQYPLCGGVYQWSKYVGSGAVGWLTGWVYLANLIITLPAVALAIQVTLPQIWEGFHFIGDPEHPADIAQNAVLLGCLLILLTTAINTVGIRLMSRINNVGVISELTGVVLLLILLAAHLVRGPQIVLDTQGRGADQPLGYLGALLAASVTATYVMYGFDTAGTLAEETLEPRRRAPRAILQALTAAAAAGALLLLFALMVTSNPQDERLSRGTGGLPFLVTSTLGDGLGRVFLCDVIFAISVCALAVHAGAIRLLFAMARDNNLPFSVPLARLTQVSRTPVVPALVVGLLAALILAGNGLLPGVLDLIFPLAIVWANLAYLFVTGSLLLRRVRGKHRREMVEGFSLGRWGLPINGLAVVWSVALITNLLWPRADEAETPWHVQYGPLSATLILLAVGVLYYGLVQRFKPGVLPEHRLTAARGELR